MSSKRVCAASARKSKSLMATWFARTCRRASASAKKTETLTSSDLVSSAALLSRNGVIAITAAISPYIEIRDSIRADIENFVEVYVHCPMETLIERDVKGLYKKALAGEIKNFTGVSDPYEAPLNPEVTFDSSKETPQVSADRIWTKLVELGLLSDDGGSS